MIFWIKFPKKMFFFRLKIEKVNSVIEFCRFELLTIFIFWTKFAQKGYLWSKTEKITIIIEVSIFELVQVPNFSLNWQFSFFGPNLSKKVFQYKSAKIEHHHRLLRIQINLVTKFLLKLTSLIFGPNLLKNSISSLKKMNTIYELCIFKGPKFWLKLTNLVFWTKFAQKEYFLLKIEKMNITVEFCLFELV